MGQHNISSVNAVGGSIARGEDRIRAPHHDSWKGCWSGIVVLHLMAAAKESAR